MGKEKIVMKTKEEIEKELKKRELEEIERASLAFSVMVAEGEALTARQEVADLNFTLMINGVI